MKLLLALSLVLSLGLSGCATDKQGGIHPTPDTAKTIQKGVDDTAFAVSNAALLARKACGNTIPDGPCAEGALLTTEQEAQLKQGFIMVIGLLHQVRILLLQGDTASAGNELTAAKGVWAEQERQLTDLGVK